MNGVLDNVVLDRLIARVGGPSAFARRIKESPQTVTNWRARGVSIEGCKKIERIFKIDRVLLRPDIFGGYQ